ncbi:WD domain, Gbeta repeat-containing protein [Acanthamoeba castellanii str. Neff]|uniref:WD domain, Gbeta repeat-containing protein n=1 Tax=Acanthamoeba castellanii (strain ATCC 30010 / Neff) TaxID=1257118 RepID=L8H6S0_ACACF|nr:WD domain, Gbeta repeat-containing protein [Acanthamoeba castellanii str. Neff]ELR20942.1 WD domain, Gbeta repeat-containing protein [Acanthamoeba castellanii str. Neff]
MTDRLLPDEEAEEQSGATQRGAFEALPDEVTFHVMSLLGGPADLLYSVGMLNTWWRDFVVDDALWKRLFHFHFPAHRWMGETVQWIPTANWQSNFKHYRALERNWRDGRCLSVKTFSDSDTLSAEERGFVLSGNESGEITQWTINSGKQTAKIEAHDGLVRCMRLIDNDSKLVSCADERVIKMFDLDKRGKLIQKFEGHRGGPWMMQIEGNRMISQSLKDIRLWDLENANCVLSIPTSAYCAESGRCFQFQGDRLVSGSDIGSVHEWDLRTGKLVGGGHVTYGIIQIYDGGKLRTTLNAHTGSVRELQFDTMKLVSGSRDCTIRVFDLTRLEEFADEGERPLQSPANSLHNALTVRSKSYRTSWWEYQAQRNTPTASVRSTALRDALFPAVPFPEPLEQLTSFVTHHLNVSVTANDKTVKIWSFLEDE